MTKNNYKLQVYQGVYAISKLNPESQIPDWALEGDWFSLTRTEEELSVVCEENFIPREVSKEGGWRLLKVLGPLDFSLVGVLSKISTVLADAGVSIFAVSTYITDYILIKSNQLKTALKALRDAGYLVY